ncbi:hypothetical protein RRG08_030232 [Elysia crispata]|uniref:Uncharacterized protein n=1 Tax=Elysia crispata TaxID=231223 RepID=A0AAE1AJZ1_9GAST|nr:hypothetical protein RRG08_030232 [Elysia crispata]
METTAPKTHAGCMAGQGRGCLPWQLLILFHSVLVQPQQHLMPTQSVLMAAPAALNPMPLRPHASPGSSLSHATPSSCQPRHHLIPCHSVLMPASTSPNPMQLRPHASLDIT